VGTILDNTDGKKSMNGKENQSQPPNEAQRLFWFAWPMTMLWMGFWFHMLFKDMQLPPQENQVMIRIIEGLTPIAFFLPWVLAACLTGPLIGIILQVHSRAQERKHTDLESQDLPGPSTDASSRS